MLERDVPEGVAERQLNLQHLMSVEIQRCEAKKFSYTTTTFKSITVQIAIEILGNFKSKFASLVESLYLVRLFCPQRTGLRTLKNTFSVIISKYLN
jgi:hypothetical protein